MSALTQMQLIKKVWVKLKKKELNSTLVIQKFINRL
jgi:hypothetical protein